MSKSGWIGVDLDGTLAFYERWDGSIGLPIPEMVERIKRWLDSDQEVRIFTARASEWEPIKDNKVWLDNRTQATCPRTTEVYERDVKPIEDWCERHLGVRLQVTCRKDFKMVELWDDRAVQVIPNTGQRADAQAVLLGPLPTVTASEIEIFRNELLPCLNGLHPAYEKANDICDLAQAVLSASSPGTVVVERDAPSTTSHQTENPSPSSSTKTEGEE
jgi:hypothetical protein